MIKLLALASVATACAWAAGCSHVQSRRTEPPPQPQVLQLVNSLSLPPAAEPEPDYVLRADTTLPIEDVFTVHVHLMYHLPTMGNPSQDSIDRTYNCHTNISHNMIYLFQQGVSNIAIEGVSMAINEGQLSTINRYMIYESDSVYVSYRLAAQLSDASVYGFEPGAGDDMDYTDAYRYFNSADSISVFERVVSDDELTRVRGNLSLIQSNIDLNQIRYEVFDLTNQARSYFAISMAYRLAVGSPQRQAQLVIGAGHLRDIQALIDSRLAPDHLRILAYDCI